MSVQEGILFEEVFHFLFMFLFLFFLTPLGCAVYECPCKRASFLAPLKASKTSSVASVAASGSVPYFFCKKRVFKKM